VGWCGRLVIKGARVDRADDHTLSALASGALHCSLAVVLQRGVDGSSCDLGVEWDDLLAAGFERERHGAFCGCAREVGELCVCV